MAQADLTELRRLNVILLGKTGSGKSSLANSLTGTNEFHVSESLESDTEACKCVTKNVNGLSLTVVDTPGTMDTRTADEALLELCTAITFCPDGFDACLLVIRLDVRFTVEERMAIELLVSVFGPNIFEHSIVVFSHGDAIDNDEQKFRSNLSVISTAIPSFGELLTQCQNRAALVDNGRRCDPSVRDSQVNHLLDMIQTMSDAHQERFTNKYFETAQTYLLEIMNRRFQPSDIAEAIGNFFRTSSSTTGEPDQEGRNEFATRKNVARRIAEDMKKDGNSCFPADAVVQTPSGPVMMSQLSVGQSVLCMQNGKLIYSPVYMWGHRDEASCSNSYVTVRTESAQLTLSSDHLLFIIDEMGDEVSVPAGDVCAGHTVQVLHHLMPDGLKCEKVVTVERCVMRCGLFAPFTICGSIIVDGVLASCYIRCMSPALSHALLWPVRFAWQLAPSAVDACNRVGDDGMPWWISVIASRILPGLGCLAVGGDGGGAEVGVRKT